MAPINMAPINTTRYFIRYPRVFPITSICPERLTQSTYAKIIYKDMEYDDST